MSWPFEYMIRPITRLQQVLTLAALAMNLSCSPRTAPVQQGVLVGR